MSGGVSFELRVGLGSCGIARRLTPAAGVGPPVMGQRA